MGVKSVVLAAADRSPPPSLNRVTQCQALFEAKMLGGMCFCFFMFFFFFVCPSPRISFLPSFCQDAFNLVQLGTIEKAKRGPSSALDQAIYFSPPYWSFPVV